MTGTPRGLRNNNPGNIRKSATVWQGMAPAQTDLDFVQFVTMTYGVRALCKILLSYHHLYDLNTIGAIIARWAPPNENDTAAYVAAVCAHMQVRSTDTLLLDRACLSDLALAIAEQENGRLIAYNACIDGAAMALGYTV